MSRHDTVVVGKTKAGKEIAYRVPEGKPLYEIFFTSGGQIPQVLSGAWNDIRQIKSVVANYLAGEKDVKPVVKKEAVKKTTKKSK